MKYLCRGLIGSAKAAARRNEGSRGERRAFLRIGGHGGANDRCGGGRGGWGGGREGGEGCVGGEVLWVASLGEN